MSNIFHPVIIHFYPIGSPERLELEKQVQEILDNLEPTTIILEREFKND